MSDSTYDVIVFGATSYGVDGELKWAAAGRSETKLQQVKEALGSKADKLALITADANDDASLEALCANTAVVISTVGPYALYGEPMIRACTSTGTDYCDLTGEAQWIADMLEPALCIAVVSTPVRLTWASFSFSNRRKSNSTHRRRALACASR